MNATGQRHAVIVGISSYGDARQNDLRFTTNDAEDLYATLVEHAGFTPQDVHLFCDNPTEKYQKRGIHVTQVPPTGWGGRQQSVGKTMGR